MRSSSIAIAQGKSSGERSRLEQTIEAERGKLLQANAVLRCLYEVLLYADGEHAVTYAEAAHVVSRLIDDSVARLDSFQLRPKIEELKTGARVIVSAGRTLHRRHQRLQLLLGSLGVTQGGPF